MVGAFANVTSWKSAAAGGKSRAVSRPRPLTPGDGSLAVGVQRVTMPRDDLPLLSEDTLRRYLRHASVILATVGQANDDRLVGLRRARRWVIAVLNDLDRLAREIQASETVDDPLIHRAEASTIEGHR
jgi:hypothetical protein